MNMEKSMDLTLKLQPKKAVKKDVEKETKKEMDQLLSSFADRNKKSQDKLNEVSNTNFWSCLVFQTERQARDFMQKAGFNPDDVYIDGVEFAKRFGIDIIKDEAVKNKKKNSNFFDVCGTI